MSIWHRFFRPPLAMEKLRLQPENAVARILMQGQAGALKALCLNPPRFQPSAADEIRFSKTATAPEPSDRLDFIAADGLPYSWYPTVPDSERVRILHPGGVGRRLYTLAKDPASAERYLHAMKSVGVRLPNGGWAWYYPRSIRISRLLGPDLKYSGMTAGDVLGGFTEVMRLHGATTWCHADDALKSLTFPWNEGGVSLNGVALLELPMFRSPPEVVLNGWLHSLLFLHDYAEISHDEGAAELLSDNLAFMAKTLHEYDDQETGLSRYSDATPYKVNIQWAKARTAPKFFVWYTSKHIEISDVVVKLDELVNPPGGPSLYDNQILARAEGSAQIQLTATQKFDTYLVCHGAPFSATVDPGLHAYDSTVPRRSGNLIQLDSQPVSNRTGGFHALAINEANLMKGSPTAFSKKGGENYYHVQHIVALLYLSRFKAAQPWIKEGMEHYARRWMSVMKGGQVPVDRPFSDPQRVLTAMCGGKPIKHATNFVDLVR